MAEQSAAEPEQYAARATRLVIHHPLGEVVAVVEIVSPGNKDSRHALRAFVEKRTMELLFWAIAALVISMIAGATGFTRLSAGAALAAKVLFGIFLAIALVLFLLVLLAVVGITAAA